MATSDAPVPRTRALLSGTVREIMVVVLSILIAFGLDAWWDAQGHRRDVVEMLSSVREEMEENRAELQSRIEQQGRAEHASQALVDLVGGNLDAQVVAVPDSLLAALWATPSFDPATGSLDATLGSPAFGHIESADLRGRLSSWMRYVRDAAEDENHALELARREFLPTVGSHARLDDVVANAYPWVFGRSVDPAFRRAVTQVSPTPRLLNFAALRASYAGAAAGELAEVLRQTDSILALIEQEVR